MSSIFTLIVNMISIVSSWLKIKSTTTTIDTLEDIQKEKEILKNEIIRELNCDDADLHYIDRLYTKLRDLSKRENKL